MINLKTALGSFKTSGAVTNVIIEDIKIPNQDTPKPKVCLIVDIGNNKTIKINEAFTYNYNQSKRQQGFWLSLDNEGKINILSTIGKMMQKYEVNTLEEFKGKNIDLCTGEKGLLVGDIT